MSVLVTGGAGYIGSHMVLDLVEHGQKALVVDDLSTGFAHFVPDGVPHIKGDISDKALIKNLIREYKVDAIAHFAAKIVVPESMTDPMGYYLANTSKARTLIEGAVEGGVKNFIFSSTAAVYGDTSSNLVTEATETSPVSPYGRSKLMVEWMLEDAARAYGINSMILRYFNVAGADPKRRAGQAISNATHLIKVAVEAATGKREGMKVFGTDYPTADGTCIRDYIHVSDLARAHGLALDYLRNGGVGTTLNCAYGKGSSVFEVIDAVKRISGVDFSVTHSERRAGDPPEIVATGDRIRTLLDWQPRYADLDQIVAHALAWEKMLPLGK
jgi:UDP-glucose 4-epimerase